MHLAQGKGLSGAYSTDIDTEENIITSIQLEGTNLIEEP